MSRFNINKLLNDALNETKFCLFFHDKTLHHPVPLVIIILIVTRARLARSIFSTQ